MVFIQVGEGEQENVVSVPLEVRLTSSTTQQTASFSTATQSTHGLGQEDSHTSQDTLPTITTVNGEYIKVREVAHSATCGLYIYFFLIFFYGYNPLSGPHAQIVCDY